MRQARLAALLVVVSLLASCGSTRPQLQSSPAVPSNGLIQGTVSGLTFEYPGGWRLAPVGHPKHYEDTLAFLTSPTATATESCGPDYIPGAGSGCSDAYSLPPGGLVIRLALWGLPAGSDGDLVAQDIAAGWEPRTVAGQPAAYSASYSDPCDPRGTSVAWFVAVPGEPWAAYVIIATASGSGNPGQETAIAGIVASVHVIARQLTVMSRT